MAGAVHVELWYRRQELVRDRFRLVQAAPSLLPRKTADELSKKRPVSARFQLREASSRQSSARKGS
jgi:hypothetical protein